MDVSYTYRILGLLGMLLVGTVRPAIMAVVLVAFLIGTLAGQLDERDSGEVD
ncbi:MAG: hypothetical protein L0Z53_06580 [Acidobacteriales bacterium]|nr:hypothetical protein [Terriglobales bacterium]